MNIVEKKVTELIPYKNNPRINDDAVPAVAASIREFGFKVPLVIDAKNVVVCGHTRLKAAESLGLETVPCIVADDLTPKQIKAFRLADNKVSEQAVWEPKLLSDELLDLQDLDVDMSPFGFDLDIPDLKGLEDDEDKENERIRTANAYNLLAFDAERAAGFYQMPMLQACKGIPKKLIGFNYVMSIEPQKGMGVHFYIDDYQFERVWNDPETNIDKLLNFDFCLTPDFSLYMDMPMAMKVWNVYRSRLVGQMLQDRGGNIIPTLSWAEEATFSFCFDGIEPGGVVSVSTIGVKRSREATEIWMKGMDEALKRLKPMAVVIYGGDIGYSFPCKAIYIDNAVTEKMKEKR